MGCFGYICNGCKTQIVGDCFQGGELAVLKHIRHGEVIGEVIGYYNEYGTVFGQDEDTGFRGNQDDLPNSHHEICKSEFDMCDSRDYDGGERRIYNSRPITLSSYEGDRMLENVIEKRGTGDLKGIYAEFNRRIENGEIRKEFEALPKIEKAIRSGTEAWHYKCYCEASQALKDAHVISESDPDQSWGTVRKKYRGEMPKIEN